jgi:hypothetical protein
MEQNRTFERVKPTNPYDAMRILSETIQSSESIAYTMGYFESFVATIVNRCPKELRESILLDIAQRTNTFQRRAILRKDAGVPV